MLNNAEVKEATSIVDKILHDVLYSSNGQPRKREQVKLIADIVQSAVSSCTVPTDLASAISLFGFGGPLPK